MNTSARVMQVTRVYTTPKELRLIADKLEEVGRTTRVGEFLRVTIAPDLIFVYDQDSPCLCTLRDTEHEARKAHHG